MGGGRRISLPDPATLPSHPRRICECVIAVNLRRRRFWASRRCGIVTPIGCNGPVTGILSYRCAAPWSTLWITFPPLLPRPLRPRARRSSGGQRSAPSPAYWPLVGWPPNCCPGPTACATGSPRLPAYRTEPVRRPTGPPSRNARGWRPARTTGTPATSPVTSGRSHPRRPVPPATTPASPPRPKPAGPYLACWSTRPGRSPPLRRSGICSTGPPSARARRTWKTWRSWVSTAGWLLSCHRLRRTRPATRPGGPSSSPAPIRQRSGGR
jgi:hypothetical protein